MRTKKSCMFFMICALAITVFIFTGLSSARAATQAQIEQSITNGLAWLAAQQQPDGSWRFDPAVSTPYYDIGTTMLVVLKFEERAKELNKNPFDNYPNSPTFYEYADNVIAGFDYMFPYAISDVNGVHFSSSIFLDVYSTGITMMAIAASNAPSRSITAPGYDLDGFTFQQALQGMMDWMAYAQNDANCEIGGWGYQANYPSFSDQSNSGYATLGVGFASAAPPAGFGLLIPGGVQTKLDMYINNVQDPMDGDSYDGGSWYEPCNLAKWVNILKTGNLLYEMALVGDTTSTTRVQNAISYIENHWNDTGQQPEFTFTSLGWKDSYQAMFTLMKGLSVFDIATLTVSGNPVNWFDEVSDVIVANQALDGSFNQIGPNVYEGEASANLRAAWALLTLERVVPPIVGIPDQCVPYGQQFATFDADNYVISGTPPFTWTWSGNVNLMVSKDADNVFTITYPIDWTGSETITFTATDANNQSSNDPATFTVDPVPVVGDIPDQTAPFSPFDLDNYLSGIDPSLVTWSYSGNSCLQVSIDGNNVVTVTNPGGVCTNAETITFTATATACGNTVSDSDPATFTPNLPPVCTQAYADPACLWSPNHTMVPVSILGVSDPDNDPVTIMITSITSDEPTATDGGGEMHAPDASGVGTLSAMIRAERSGGGDGRVYMINFTASDSKGGTCTGSVAVKVPRNRSDKTCPAIDSGQLYDATQVN